MGDVSKTTSRKLINKIKIILVSVLFFCFGPQAKMPEPGGLSYSRLLSVIPNSTSSGSRALTIKSKAFLGSV